MHFSIVTAISALALLASSAQASHDITLYNNCGHAVTPKLNNWPSGTPYNGPPIGTIASGGSKKITVPNSWNGRICDSVGGCGGSGNCFGQCSMVEFNMDSKGLNYYDISNIQAFTVAQKIASTQGCETVTCGAANCPCKQAYRPGDISGTCGGTGPKDQAVRACGKPDFTVTYCP